MVTRAVPALSAKVNPVSRRLRRLPFVLLPALLLAGLTACGSDDGSSASQPLDSVSISGDVGEQPKVTWKDQLQVDGLETKTLTTGDGPAIADGDKVNAQIWIGNGYTEKKAYSTYDSGTPQSVTVGSDQLNPLFADAITAGKTIGSRIVVTTPADKAFGEAGNPQLGIGNKDSVLAVIDLVSKSEKPLDGPDGAAQKAPSWAPKLVRKGDAVTALDFSKAPKPNGKLRKATLVKGTGATVEKGQTITVDYLGQVYGGKKPFDESYSKDPASFGIGTGQVIPGWDKTLVGTKVGSRVLLAIPPKEGYGSKGNSAAGIKGTDTLYFVVDILAAG
jgi:peptidylprolyl isomerase